MPTAHEERNSPTPRLRSVGLFLVLLSLASTTSLAKDQPSEVFIYYANETAPEGQEAANYDTIIGWLRSTDNEKHAEIADQLGQDRRIFVAAVDVELNTLLRRLPDIENGPQAVIFTNRLVRQGKCLMWRHEWSEFRDFKFPVPQQDNYITAANPLSDPDTMRGVLAFVADEFPPDSHEFILVTKSHGSASRAIIPRLTVRAEETNQEEVLRVAVADMDGDELPEWAGRLGISKDEFFSILGEAEMQFSLVYWEACETLSGEFRPAQVPDNVDRLLLIAENAHYINVVYGDILARVGDGKRLSDAMLYNLASKFIMVGEGGLSRWPLWVFFVPLGLFVLWAIWQWGPWDKRKARTRQQQDALPTNLH